MGAKAGWVMGKKDIEINISRKQEEKRTDKLIEVTGTRLFLSPNSENLVHEMFNKSLTLSASTI